MSFKRERRIVPTDESVLKSKETKRLEKIFETILGSFWRQDNKELNTINSTKTFNRIWFTKKTRRNDRLIVWIKFIDDDQRVIRHRFECHISLLNSYSLQHRCWCRLITIIVFHLYENEKKNISPKLNRIRISKWNNEEERERESNQFSSSIEVNLSSWWNDFLSMNKGTKMKLIRHKIHQDDFIDRSHCRFSSNKKKNRKKSGVSKLALFFRFKLDIPSYLNVE